jgi:serine/threonine protein kinase
MASYTPPATAALNQEDWRILEAAVEGLEQAWRTGANPRVRDFVPHCATHLRAHILAELVKVDQEHRWERQDRQLLEAYLAEWPELAESSELLTGLVEAECLTRAIVDRLPTLGELAERFPAVAGRLDLAQLAVRAQREEPTARVAGPPVSGSDTSHLPWDDTPVPVARPRPLRPGMQLGRYRIDAVLGCGGMGTVYRAYDTQLAREVAVKVPRWDPSTESDLLHRFVREARMSARIRHPHVCPVFDAGWIDGTPYLTMAHIDGGSLEDRLREGPLEPREAVEIVCKVAEGVARVHAAGLIHRDIKPSNVLMDRLGEPCLADFGLARDDGGASGTAAAGLCSGTPAYMAPEQLRGGLVDARSDVFSLGGLLQRLITGQPPRPIRSSDAAASPHDACDASLPAADMAARLRAICERAMHVEPAHRYASADEFAADLAAYMRRSDEACARRRVLRRPLAVAGLAAALLGLLGILCVDRKVRTASDGPHRPPVASTAHDTSVDRVGTAPATASTRTDLLHSMLTVLWSSPMTHDTPTAISRVQMLPKGNHLLVLYNTTSSRGKAAQLAAQTGELCWQKQLQLEGRVFENGWVNRQGEVFLTSSVEGYTIWKTDVEFSQAPVKFRAGPGCEYISAIITDHVDNIYIAGFEGSRPGAGSTCAKLTPALEQIWEHNTRTTDGKDDYSLDMDLDGCGTLYRVGYDNPSDDQSHVRGRVLRHRDDTGELLSTYVLEEANSLVAGVLADGNGCWYQAYSYDVNRPSGDPTGTERTVVEKRDSRNQLLWRDEFPWPGVAVSRNALSWGVYGSFLLVFQVTVEGQSYPGLALYSCDRGRVWLKLVDRPGWNFSRAGAEVVARTAYLGLNNGACPMETDVVAVPLDRQ